MSHDASVQSVYKVIFPYAWKQFERDEDLVSIARQLVRAVSRALHEVPRRMEPRQAALAILMSHEAFPDGAASDHDHLADRVVRAVSGTVVGTPDGARAKELRRARDLIGRYNALTEQCPLKIARNSDAFAQECAKRRKRIMEVRLDLQHYQRSRSILLDLDTLMPGWVDLDVSDYVPKGTPQFVSNRPDEWYTWLLGHGVSVNDAENLVQDAFEGWSRPDEGR